MQHSEILVIIAVTLITVFLHNLALAVFVGVVLSALVFALGRVHSTFDCTPRLSMMVQKSTICRDCFILAQSESFLNVCHRLKIQMM